MLHPDLHSFLPADPQVPSGEEAGHGVSGEMMDPALLSQLTHDGVYPGEARPSLRPLGERLRVFVPRDANTDGVSFHFVEAWIVGRCGVEELPPQ